MNWFRTRFGRAGARERSPELRALDLQARLLRRGKRAPDVTTFIESPHFRTAVQDALAAQDSPFPPPSPMVRFFRDGGISPELVRKEAGLHAPVRVSYRAAAENMPGVERGYVNGGRRQEKTRIRVANITSLSAASHKADPISRTGGSEFRAPVRGDELGGRLGRVMDTFPLLDSLQIKGRSRPDREQAIARLDTSVMDRLKEVADALIDSQITSGKEMSRITVSVCGHGSYDPHLIRILLDRGIIVVSREDSTIQQDLLREHSDLRNAWENGRLIISSYDLDGSDGTRYKTLRNGVREKLPYDTMDIVIWSHPHIPSGNKLKIIVERLSEDGLLIIQTESPEQYIDPLARSSGLDLVYRRDGIFSRKYVLPTAYLPNQMREEQAKGAVFAVFARTDRPLINPYSGSVILDGSITPRHLMTHLSHMFPFSLLFSSRDRIARIDDLERDIDHHLAKGDFNTASNLFLRLANRLWRYHRWRDAERAWFAAAKISRDDLSPVDMEKDINQAEIIQWLIRKGIVELYIKDATMSMDAGRLAFFPGIPDYLPLIREGFYDRNNGWVHKVFGRSMALKVIDPISADGFVQPLRGLGIYQPQIDVSGRVRQEVEALSRMGRAGIRTIKIYKVFSDAVLREFVHGPKIDQLSRPAFGLDEREIGEARSKYLDFRKSVIASGEMLDSQSRIRENAIYDLDTKEWVIIDP